MTRIISQREVYRDLLYAKDINRLITSRTPTGKIIYQNPFDTVQETNAFVLHNKTGVHPEGYKLLDREYPFRGGGALLIGCEANKFVNAILTIGLPKPLKKIGIEFHMAFPKGTGAVNRLTWEARYWNGIGYYTADYRFDMINLWQFITGGVLTTLATKDIGEEAWYAAGRAYWVPYHYIKTIIDFENLTFNSLTVDDSTWLHSHPLDYSALAGTYTNTLSIHFGLYRTVAGVMRVDDLIITEEE